ncbi:MAG: hypothetical protein EI684_12465 [Candidatus Viridilinea halotolerans]|uniref:CRISPR-associated protein n=1 Tax=Candidatus Viridilinea halotolerans TaxID=2491704 RepID=A0A426TY78_9CHLR|nr:MAG: hypothetical protein EI684_12465 [Candidatus Viridilinea halotolerans]
MNSPSLTKLFRPFLETRAPLLFLIGSIALGILSSAVYELLTTTFGATPQFLIGLVISAMLIFTFVAFSFQRLLRAYEQRQVVTHNPVAPDQQAEPHAGLILPVGMSNPGAELDIIVWHLRDTTLRHCWLLASPQVMELEKFGNLRQYLLEHNVIPHPVKIDDAMGADQIYTTVMATIKNAQNDNEALPLIADITGGTKVMTVGIVLACLDTHTTVQYWQAPRDRTGNPRMTDASRPMKIMVHRTP